MPAREKVHVSHQDRAVSADSPATPTLFYNWQPKLAATQDCYRHLCCYPEPSLTTSRIKMQAERVR